MFNNAMNFLVEQCGASVVLCTATQPLLHEVDKAKGAMRFAEDAELIPNAPQLFHDLKRYETFDKSSKPWSSTEVGGLAMEEMLEQGSCLVIVNTKRDAQAVYMACKELLNTLAEPMEEGCFVHLSTRMCPAHRLEALEMMKVALAQEKRVLCVSTQLIEAGVDIDFASVVRDLAGLDSIAQAAGRCNRNGGRASGRVHIVKMAEPLPKQLAELIRAQANAGRVLADWRDDHPHDPFPLSDPAKMKQFYRHYFFERKSEMDYPVKIPNMRDDTLLRMLGENYIAVEYAEHTGLSRRGFMQSFKTAAEQFHVIDKSTQGVIVPFGEEGNELINALSAAPNLAVEFQLLRKAQRFAVDLYQHEWASLTRSQAIKEVQQGTGVFRLLKEYYSDEFGLTLDDSGKMESMIV
jgi:CRISPR-associated endonuclease/helicase Cas3